MSARRVLGIEGALVDHSEMRIAALTSDDVRAHPLKVAGPAALRLGRDRLVDIAGVQEDRLRADEDEPVVLGCKDIERIQQRPTGRRIQRRDVSHRPCRQRWRAEVPRPRPVRDRAP